MNNRLLSLIKNAEVVTYIGESSYLLENPMLKLVEGQVLKLDCYFLLRCVRGEIELKGDLSSYTVRGGQSSYLMKGQLLEVVSVSDSFQSVVFLLSDSTLDWLDLDSSIFFIQDSRSSICSSEYGSLLKLATMLKKIAEYDTHPDCFKVIKLLIQSYIIALSHVWSKENDFQTDSDSTSSSRIMKKYFGLLSGGKLHRSTGYYADSLCISSKHLSYISRQCTGFSAAYWIDRKTLLEAKYLLCSSDIPVAEVSASLGFSCQSTFARFFKNQTGVSPTEYRRRCRK